MTEVFDQEACAKIIEEIAFKVFQELPEGSELILTKNGIGKPKSDDSL